MASARNTTQDRLSYARLAGLLAVEHDIYTERVMNSRGKDRNGHPRIFVNTAAVTVAVTSVVAFFSRLFFFPSFFISSP